MRVLISKALIRIMTDHPFFSNILLRLKIVEDKNLSAIMGVNSTTLFYNENVFDEFETSFNDVRVLTTICVHEAMHIAMKHTIRSNKLKPIYGELFGDHFSLAMNEAMDLSINSLLLKEHNSAFTDMLKSDYVPLMPEQGLYKKYPHNKTFEEYAKMIVDEYRAEEENGGDSPMHDRFDEAMNENGISMVLESDDDLDQEAEGRELDTLIAGASNACKGGLKTSSLEKTLISEFAKPPKVNWKLAINNFIQSRSLSGENYNRMSRRNPDSGIVMPNNESSTISNIILLSDQSGSIDDSKIEDIKNHMDALLRAYRGLQITFVPFDSEVDEANIVEYSASNLPIKSIKRTASGGTLFMPPLKYAESISEASGIIMITDMLPADGDLVNNMELQHPLLYLDVLGVSEWDYAKLKPHHGRVIKV